MPKERDAEYLTGKQTPQSVENPMEEIYLLQEHLIEETESLVKGFFDEIKVDLINFDAIQAICFLIVADQYVHLGKEELGNCLALLGVPHRPTGYCAGA